MPVFRGSRYEGVPFTGILGEDGKVRRFLHARRPFDLRDMRNPILVHTLQRGDELDAIVNRASGKPRLWWFLADVNSVVFPLGLMPGTEIAVPILELQDRQEFGG